MYCMPHLPVLYLCGPTDLPSPSRRSLGNLPPHPQAYAMTGHGSQGATLHGVIIINVRPAFAPGLLYVMLGRVCSRKQLIIVGDLEPSMFKPIIIDF